jgi:hypothetical protein
MGEPLAALVGFASAVAYLLVAPSVVNGDGLGYLNASVHGDLYPGHLLYEPLLRALRALFSVGPRPVDGLAVARALSAVSGGVAVFAIGRAARRLDPQLPTGARASPVVAATSPVVAALGLACSFGAIVAASDVETYAPALAALCLAVWALAARRAGGGPRTVVAAGLAIALAALFHVENALFGLVALAALPRDQRRRDWPLLVATAGLVTVGVYAAVIVASSAPTGASSWLRGASHGFRYPVHWYTPAVAVYGASKALLYSPYPYEASWLLVVGHFVPGVIALVALGRMALGGRAPLGRSATIVWVVSYGAVGVAFFPSDTERWIFLLPLFWLAVAAARRHARAALAVAIALGVLNVAVWLPRARDQSWRDRADRAATHAEPGDLIVSPGHGWDEYIGFYAPPTVGHYPIVFHTGRLGSAELVRRDLAEAVRDARKRGHRVLLVRFDLDDDPMGWKELAPFGITRDQVRTLLPGGREVPLGDGVYRLDPAP